VRIIWSYGARKLSNECWPLQPLLPSSFSITILISNMRTSVVLLLASIAAALVVPEGNDMFTYHRRSGSSSRVSVGVSPSKPVHPQTGTVLVCNTSRSACVPHVPCGPENEPPAGENNLHHKRSIESYSPANRLVLCAVNGGQKA